MSVTVTKRELASRFVDLLGTQPTDALAQALMQAAFEAGYTSRDIPALINAVEHQLRLKRGAVEVQVTTAHELSAADTTAIAQRVADAAGATSFNVVDRVDPALLGGFEASADGVTLRDSIRFNLNNSGVLHG